MSNPTCKFEFKALDFQTLPLTPLRYCQKPSEALIYCITTDNNAVVYTYGQYAWTYPLKELRQKLADRGITMVYYNAHAVDSDILKTTLNPTPKPLPVRALPFHNKRITRVEPGTAIVTLLQSIEGDKETFNLVHLLKEGMTSCVTEQKHFCEFLNQESITTLLVDTCYVDISDVEDLLSLPLELVEEPPAREKRIGGYRFNRCFSELDYTTAKGLKVFIHNVQHGRVQFSTVRGGEDNFTAGAFYNWLKDNGVTTIHINSDLDIDEVAVLLDIHD